MISATYSYQVRYVKNITTRTGKNITVFSIGEKIMNSEPKEYINWQCTVWGKLDLQDGQKIKIDRIVNVSCEIYAGRKQYKLTLEATPVTGNEDFVPPQDDDAPLRKSSAVTDTGKPAEPFFPADDDTLGHLPFDI